MPRRRWRLKARREPLSPAMCLYLELGLGGLQVTPKAARPDGYAEAVYFSHPRDREVAWQEHGAEITATWIAAHAGSRPWGWWRFVATVPRTCLEGAEFVTRVAGADWIWRQEFGLPGRPQARKPGAAPATMLFESEAAYLRRLNLLVPGEEERLTAEDFESEVVEVPEIAELAQVDARFPPAPALAATNGAPHRHGKPAT